MSVGNGDTIGQFEQVLNALMSPDNAIRGQAEVAFNQVCTRITFHSLIFQRNAPLLTGKSKPRSAHFRSAASATKQQ